MKKSMNAMQTQPKWAGLAMAVLAAVAVGCSKAETAATTAATTMTISGEVEVPSSFMSDRSYLFQDPTMMATACSDGNTYQVRCVGFGATVAAGEGTVNCGTNASSGGFTVAGMPIGEPIGCFIRRSANGTDYTTLGTIELPAATLGGASGTIVAGGDMQFNVKVTSTGTISAEIVKDTRTETTVSTDPTSISGIYDLTCPTQAEAGGASSGFNQVACKCFLGNSGVYSSGNGVDEKTACILDNASLITSSEIQIELNVYKGTSATGMTDNQGRTVVPAGGNLYAVSVWGTDGSGNSARDGGGEGLNTFNSKVVWATTQASGAIAWHTGATSVDHDGNGGTPDVTFDVAAAPPGVSASVGDWTTWLAALVADADDNGFDCTWGDATTPEDDARCLAQFAEEVLRKAADNVNLPRVRVEYNCDNSGCESAVAEARIHVEGMHYDYEDWGDDNSTITGDDGVGPGPRNRMVMEQWMPLPGGAGAFKQNNEWTQPFRCSADGSYDVTDGACSDDNTHHDALICHVREEMGFTFGNNGSIVFENRTAATGYQWRLAVAGTPTTNGLAKCNELVMASDGLFKAKATKVP